MTVAVALSAALLPASTATPAQAEQTNQWDFVRSVWHSYEDGSPFYGVDAIRDNIGGWAYAVLWRGTCGYEGRIFQCDLRSRIVPIPPHALEMGPALSTGRLTVKTLTRTHRVTWTAETDPRSAHVYADVLQADQRGVAGAVGAVRWASARGRAFGRRLPNTNYAYLLTEAIASRRPPPSHSIPARATFRPNASGGSMVPVQSADQGGR